MKSQILHILEKNNRIVSGDTISAALEISRVSVWKHIRELQELDYKIIVTPKGYQLFGTIGTPFPREFSGREAKVHYFPELGSTMDTAREMAGKGCPHFTVVVAGRQKNGRGRLKREWCSLEGGLYFTLILRPKIPPIFSARLIFCASLTLANLLNKKFSVPAQVKWPNDILVRGRKISGMLSEMEAEGDRVTFINIGIGINVNNDPTFQADRAISLREILKESVSRKELLSMFLDAFENRVKHTNLDHVVSEWKQYAMMLNRKIRIVTRDEISEGLAKDVDENGTLILELADGSVKEIVHGDCFHLG
ncbi:MAG: biotin--[acetyl-CoA-carboxylase] ligase [Desulfobacterales bacterium]|jgi:BirA family biotin operon repressor/biotin-[acetyl-CoA-carboxylase] ligase|nr:biotin--[acetyl-CoA-carboxylase] ligase [Desulfobacterales bacterium]